LDSFSSFFLEASFFSRLALASTAAVSSAGADRAKSKLSSDHQSVKKLSESFASSKLSDYSSYTSGLHDSSLDSFDYKFSSAKLSESRSRPLEGGVFTSTPKYSDLSSNSGYLSRTTSSSVFSTADSGYSGASGASLASSRTSPESIDRERTGRAAAAPGKISLGALKRPEMENWESTNSAILRRGVSSTYIG